MACTRNVPVPRKLTALVAAALAVSILPGCMNLATLTGEPSYVGMDPSVRSVCQAPLWEGGAYFVYDNGGRTFLMDRKRLYACQSTLATKRPS